MADQDQPSTLYGSALHRDGAEAAGFRFGAKGTHTSRTMMFAELCSVIAGTSPTASRADYAASIIESNSLGKTTASTRRLTNQRLGELYGLDPAILIFRVLRRLWDEDEAGRRMLALQCAIARDPLLAATVDAITSLPAGAELQRDALRAAVRRFVSERLNDSTLDKVIRNVASSWAQSGHLEGRTFKRRRRVTPTAGAVAYGLYLGRIAGFRGAQLFSSGWITLLDCPPSRARDLALDAKRLGLIDLRISGDVVDIAFQRLERLG